MLTVDKVFHLHKSKQTQAINLMEMNDYVIHNNTTMARIQNANRVWILIIKRKNSQFTKHWKTSHLPQYQHNKAI